MREPSVTEFAFIVRSISGSHFSLWGKAHSSMSIPEHEISSATFYPNLWRRLVIFMQSSLLNVSTGSSSPTQMPVFKYFFTAQLCSEKWHILACGLPKSSAHVLHVQEHFARVYVSEQNPNDSCLHRESWVLKKQKETLHHSLIQAKVTWRWEHACPVPP